MTNKRVVIDPTVAEGKPIIQGTEISVPQILAKAAAGMSPAQIADSYPVLELADVSAAFNYAANITSDQTSHKPNNPEQNGTAKPVKSTGQLPRIALDLNKVLVVDDTPINLEYMKALFAKEEFSLSLASSGQEGLEKARQEAPFLILCDIQMPGMSGLQLCEKIKADPRTCNAALIFVTAFGNNTNLVSKGLNMGADDFLVQPFEKEELLARVRAVARLKRAEIEAQRQASIASQRNQGLELLNELAVAAASSLSLEMVYGSALQQLAHLLAVEAVSILLIDRSAGSLTINITSHAGTMVSTSILLKDRPEIHANSLKNQAPEIIAEILKDPNHSQSISLPASPNDVDCVPMISQEGIIGTIAIINKNDNQITPEDWSLLNSAVGIITVAVENARLFDQAKNFNRRLEHEVRERTSELNQEKKKVEAILVSMADGVLVLDDRDHVSTVNTAGQEILGAHANKFIGLSIDAPALDTPLWDAVRKLVEDPELTVSASVDVQDPSQSGGLRSIQANSATVYDEGGRTIGTVIVLSDVTAIVEVERMKARFMAGVTHELKTPLAIIKLQTNNLAAYHARLSEAKRNDLLKTIQGQVQLLEQLIEDILELSHLDSSANTLDRELMNLIALVEEVISESQPLAAGKGIALSYETSQQELPIEADFNKLKWLVGNLVDNAIKYTPARGNVRIEVSASTLEGKPAATVLVTDNGIGIPKSEHTRIFERFYRVDSSHTIPGTGLGLSIVKEIAEAHGGDVSITSPPNGGSVFTVRLPEK